MFAEIWLAVGTVPTLFAYSTALTSSSAIKRLLNAIGLFVRRWLGLARIFFGVSALVLGLWGWEIVAPAFTPTFNPMGLANNLFRTLQMLTLQMPREFASAQWTQWQLVLARLMLPMIGFIESYRLVLGAIRNPARLAMLGIRFGHIILVPGKGPVGRAMLRDAQVRDLRAVAVAPDLLANERFRMEEYGLPVLNADPYLDATWHQTRADHAGLVVVSHGTDIDNLNIVVTIADALRSNPHGDGPILLVTLESEALAEQVDGALDSAARGSSLRYRRLSVPDEAARMIFLEPPLSARKVDRAQPSHIIIIGLGAGARAVLRQALTLGQDTVSSGPTVTVLAPDKELAAEALLRPDVVPAYVATLRLVPCDLTSGVPEAVLDTMLSDAPPAVLACVCLTDDAAVTVGIALSRHAALREWPDFTIAVHQGREDRFLQLLARENTVSGHARLRPFGGILPAGTLQRLQTESDDTLPRAVHEHYLETLRRLDTPGGTPIPWDALPENMRHANRAAADHMAVKLAGIGCRVARGELGAFAFTGAEIDGLACMEHRRWSAERLLRGWRLGARDDHQRFHPDLIPFEDLPEGAREKDRDAVRTMPEILALAGLSIRRGV
jgi:RyR domain